MVAIAVGKVGREKMIESCATINKVEESEKRFQSDETGHVPAPGTGLPDRSLKCHIP